MLGPNQLREYLEHVQLSGEALQPSHGRTYCPHRVRFVTQCRTGETADEQKLQPVAMVNALAFWPVKAAALLNAVGAVFLRLQPRHGVERLNSPLSFRM